jgi:hypothetical protein
MAAAKEAVTTMSDHPFVELTDRELSGVAGGFLPLLGLIGPIAGIAGQIMGGIGKSKQDKAQKEVQSAQNEQQQVLGQQGGGQGQGGQGQGQPQAPTRQLTAGMMGEQQAG